MNDNNQIKGLAASAGTIISGIAVWLPMLDAVLRTAVEVLGVVAGWYAARYWRHKWINRNKKKSHHE